MIVSMVLQALYNVVDSIFVANIEGDGVIANQALTLAFPIQILIIAIGVGTGVGINAVLSKSLGERDGQKASAIAGNGIFLSLVIYAVFLLFGIFGARWFISLFTKSAQVIDMGATYLRICCCLSLGTTAYTVYERFLQATGKTMLSTIAQISGALTNIVLDYVFIFPLNMGTAGAAWATVTGQFVSLFVAMGFHYFANKEISGRLKYMKPNGSIIKSIYKIGSTAIVMQALLAVMMAGMNAILGTAKVDSAILVGSFGIYYKIQQIALFSAFGLSNTIITVLSFNYGMRNKKRSSESVKYGVTDTLIVTFVLAVLFEIIADPLSELFSLSGGASSALIKVCATATRIGATSFIFMGFTVAVQGVLQALGYSVKPLILSVMRLALFVFPVAYLFTLSSDVIDIVWWTFLIAEVLTCVFSAVFLRKAVKDKVLSLADVETGNNRNDTLIITISREHGTKGKQIGKILAEKLGIKFYDKELSMLEAKRRGLNNAYVEQIQSEQDDYQRYMSLEINKESAIAQSEIIREIAQNESFVIVGRCADYVLRDCGIIKVFLYAPTDYKIQSVMDMYGDSAEEAKKRILKSNEARAEYYESVTGQKWGSPENFDLCIDCSCGSEKVVETILKYVLKRENDKPLNDKSQNEDTLNGKTQNN
ncbi:MAG: MATE family efflux transporter [Christensenellales bacterium]